MNEREKKEIEAIVIHFISLARDAIERVGEEERQKGIAMGYCLSAAKLANCYSLKSVAGDAEKLFTSIQTK